MRRGFSHSRWRHQMELFSALLALCAGNSPVTGEFPSQRSVTRSFNVFFDLHLNKRLSKQLRRQWFETPSGSIWRQFNELYTYVLSHIFFVVVISWDRPSLDSYTVMYGVILVFITRVVKSAYIIIPPPNEVGGGVYWIHLVRPSVRLSVCPSVCL